MKTPEQIEDEISLGEDSVRQFKEKLHSSVQIATEIAAMSNSHGGYIYIGVKDNNTITGMSQAEVGLYNQYISAAANEHIRPAVYPQTQIVRIEEKIVLVIEVPAGPSKPYADKDGVYWVKSGSDKRKASPQELLRLFQKSSLLFLDETTTRAGVNEVDRAKFFTFFERLKGQEVRETGLSIEQVLQNMNLAADGFLTLGGLLLFGRDAQSTKHFCLIRAVSYPGNAISDDQFIDRKDCLGTIDEQFRAAMNFLKSNLSNIQTGDSFNTPGVLEISEKVLEEAVVNALIHRDYSKNAVIRLLIYKDRVELISPGSLPNHLSIENIKNGNSVMRNPVLASYGTKMLPYSGIGSGVPRIMKNHPETELVNDADGEQFTVIFKRAAKRQ